MSGRPRRSLWDRLWDKVDMSGGPTACWPWRGGKSKKRRGTQRGIIFVRTEFLPDRPKRHPNRTRQVFALVHVVALAWKTDGELVKHDPATGERLEACHSCHAPQGDCCNPDHLYWGTSEQNRADRYGTQGDLRGPDRRRSDGAGSGEAVGT